MNKRFICILSLLTCSLYACGDDSGTSTQTGTCAPGQVLAKNGICYDDASCASCSADEVCVSGKCYDKDGACGQCAADQVCVGEKCYASGSACAKCREDQICNNDTCFEAGDPCAKCGADEKCEGGACVKKTLDECDIPCGSGCCTNGMICGESGECEDPNAARCGDQETECGEACCPAGQVCDQQIGECVEECPEARACGEACCAEYMICVDNMCRANCPYSDPCGLDYGDCCPTETPACVNFMCQARCDNGTLCGENNELCCEGGTPDCVDNVCKPACAGSRCGETNDLCCDAGTEICLYDECLPKGNSCKTANDCKIDEFCEDSTGFCVNTDLVPNTCEVRPEPGAFEPKTQWHWPKTSMPNGVPGDYPAFDQVMNIPAVINLTDDNGDGKIDDNDIPDLIFTSFSKTNSACPGVEGGCHYTGMNVLRVISGDDGREIATHPDMIFGLQNDPGAAKVNHDEYPEIVTTLRIRRMKDGVPVYDSDGKPVYDSNVLILNLVPKEDGTGYAFKEVARLPGGGAFPRFANLDGGEFPQIVTASGIIEYVEENGTGTYRWRCNRSFGGGHTGSTVADLDGDGEMEIVGAQIFNKNCELVSTDSVYSGTVLADLDLVQDHENGRLDVEQIGFASGGYGTNASPVPPPGKIATYKVFKTEDGKFRREMMWEKEMPIDYAYAESHLAGYKYDDGTPFKCTRAYADSWSGTDTKSVRERVRRKTCSTGGGPLVIGDFDGDKKPDIGLVTTWSFVIYAADGHIIWADFTTQDASSMATGASLFDFEGDGIAEVLYADEVELHVYKGPGSGVIDPKFNYCSAELLITPIPNSSGTLVEYPIVVDVDNDGHSEIVLTANDYSGTQSATGIRAFEDPGNHWVRTRKIWNQYDYHVTNINEDGTVPKREEQNWKSSKLNNFRQNVQPGGLFNAPNLIAAEIVAGYDKCTDDIITLRGKAENKGSLGVKSGASVRIYAVNPNGRPDDVLIASLSIPKTLTPGASYEFAYDWDQKIDVGGVRETVRMPVNVYYVIDEPTADKPFGEFTECVEDDNKSAAAEVKECIKIN